MKVSVCVCVTKFSGSRKVEYDPIKFQHKLTRNNKKAGKLKEGRIQLRFEFTNPLTRKYKGILSIPVIAGYEWVLARLRCFCKYKIYKNGYSFVSRHFPCSVFPDKAVNALAPALKKFCVNFTLCFPWSIRSCYVNLVTYSWHGKYQLLYIRRWPDSISEYLYFEIWPLNKTVWPPLI
jgi:hypothetical protein